MRGFIVRHKKLGVGKITDIQNRRISISFIDGKSEIFGADILRDGWLSRATLEAGHHCLGPEGECDVTQIIGTPKSDSIPYQYEISYRSGLRAAVSEIDLTPLSPPKWEHLRARFEGLGIQSNGFFQVRERLLKSYNKMLREGAGLRALLSSRVDLHAHQAYVSGRVLLDPIRRYLLADEVGLGKTIEAGIIISDLLAQKPKAQILILCPATLTQQWFCEIYSKFGGQVFTLLDIGGRTLSAKQVRRSICSTTFATYQLRDKLLQLPWDMVVVDEVHQLLPVPAIYDFVQALSKTTTSLLLLSALPAQRREDDFLRLLALLEPSRYATGLEVAPVEFLELYEAQSDIGRRLRMLSKRIDAMSDDDPTGAKVVDFAPRLLQLPVVAADPTVSRIVKELEPETPQLAEKARSLVNYVADNYRINRRILRNRRARLFEAGQLVPTSRKYAPAPYEPDALEIEVLSSADALCSAMKQAGISVEVLAPFMRLMVQSLVSPSSALTFFEELEEETPEGLTQAGRDYISIGYMFGYQDWDSYAGLVWKAVRKYARADLLRRCIDASELWFSGGSRTRRVEALLSLIKVKKKASPSAKFIVFAGYPGAARELYEFMETAIGTHDVTCFYEGLSQDTKEENVRKFQSNAKTWILVSDESGGEGRNFQFADELFHFDTPWYAARVEQRIGRLDRLGRDKYRADVISNVLYCNNSKEAALVRCYAEGIKVYENSVSGLEFALRDVEELIATSATSDDMDEMIDLIPKLVETATSERASDESEAVLDEASFEAKGAERFRRVSESANSTSDLEESFVEYFRIISAPKSAKEYYEAGFPKGIWRFYADDAMQPLPSLERNSEGLFGEYRGTFRRDIAQRRPDLQFFNVGNTFFDSVVGTLRTRTDGRTFAVACFYPGDIRWTGFKFVFTSQPDLSVLEGNYGLANQAESIFTANRKIVFVDSNGSLLTDRNLAKKLNDVHISLDRAGKNRTWWNLTNDKTKHLVGAIPETAWRDVVDRAYNSAVLHATDHFKEKLAERITSELERIRELRRQLEIRNDAGSTTELANLQVLEFALTNWGVDLDSIGFLSVNDLDPR